MNNLYLTLITLFMFSSLFGQETVIIKESSTEEVFTVVEDMPDYPGGLEAMQAFLKKNLKYPETELKNKIEGTVVVNFIVEKDGSLSNIKIQKTMSENFDAEAMRVVSEMPVWTPGKQRGNAVRVFINMPIRFSLK